MVDNISAYNLRLAKAKRRIQSNAKKWGLSLTKAAVQRQAVIDLRLRDPKWIQKARNMVKKAIINSGEKLMYFKSHEITDAARSLIKDGQV